MKTTVQTTVDDWEEWDWIYVIATEYAGDADFDFRIWFVSFPGRVLVEEQPIKLLKAFMQLNPHYANKIYVKKYFFHFSELFTILGMEVFYLLIKPFF